MQIKLARFKYTKDRTLGLLMLPDPHAMFFTLEPPWKENAKSISCIPNGQYFCHPQTTQKFGFTWEVQDVPGRSDILFHIGNYPKDTTGCILLGEDLEDSSLKFSKQAMTRFREATCMYLFLQLTVYDMRGKQNA